MISKHAAVMSVVIWGLTLWAPKAPAATRRPLRPPAAPR
jgi:hypothetical protein